MAESAFPTREELLRIYLAKHDEPCPGCAYNLRGLTGTRCPECNQELRMRVGLVEPRLGWFITGVVGIGMGLGFSGILLAWAGVSTLIIKRIGTPRFREIVPLIVGTIFASIILLAWVRARRRVGALPFSTRWAWAVGAILGALIGPLWFFTIIR